MLGSSTFARRYLQNRCYFLFLQVLRYFSSLRFPSCHKCRIPCLPHGGFPHSDSHGSSRTYCSPWRFAVSCVLRRLLVPRHSLCALSSLTFFNSLRQNLSTFQRSNFTYLKLKDCLGLSKLNMMSVWKCLYVFIHMPFSLERR